MTLKIISKTLYKTILYNPTPAAHVCFKSSLSAYLGEGFAIEGVNETHMVGEAVRIRCDSEDRYLTRDEWDSNSTDGTLTAVCKPGTTDCEMMY